MSMQDRMESDREEFVRNLNHNYLRVRLSEKPQEKKFQYCILQRGGIGHLLPCDLRYINDEAFLYYDITSLQNLRQIFQNRKVDRKWFGDFLWGIQKVQGELCRFLLEQEHLVWSPEHVFQDYEKNDFYFQFIPYENHEGTFKNILDFIVENLDYKDDDFVEFFYGIYEQYDRIGADFIVEKLHTEYEKFLEEEKGNRKKEKQPVIEEQPVKEEMSEDWENDDILYGKRRSRRQIRTQPEREAEIWGFSDAHEGEREEKVTSLPKQKKKRKSLFGFLLKSRKHFSDGEDVVEKAGEHGDFSKAKIREQFQQEEYEQMVSEPETRFGFDAEKFTEYTEEELEYGKTVYIENEDLQQDRGLYRENGELLVRLTEFPFVVGKKRDEVQYAFTHPSVSRIHARFLFEDGEYYLEDINSTNGSFKNGLRLRPYEKRKLEREDEIRFGSLSFTFR